MNYSKVSELSQDLWYLTANRDFLNSKEQSRQVFIAETDSRKNIVIC